MTFTEEGDPVKCAVIVKINDKGEYEFYKSVMPIVGVQNFFNTF